MPGLLNTALSGLQVSQTALKTTGHNIANANTPGYSRQRVDIATNTPNLTGAGFIGNGANVNAIERVVDEFLIEQLRQDTTLNGELSAFSENIRQLDILLSDPSTGLSQGLDRFFAIMENGADDPTSIPSRQLIISEAENLSQRFNTLYERIFTVSDNIDGKMDVAITQVNALAENIATINGKIAQSVGGSGQTPNDLLDQREEALRKLAELVSIDVVDQGDGMVNVSIGSGQTLVIGTGARELQLVDGVLDPQLADIAIVDRVGPQVITSLVSGGELGGLLDFRDSVLASSLNELGRVAMVMSDSFNRAHQLGIDLNNQFGGDFFRDVNDPQLATSRIFGKSDNNPPIDRVMTVELVDGGQLTASDYTLQVSNVDSSYQITRESDGAVVYRASLPLNLPQSVEFDGLRLTFAQGSFQSGDEFLIQPTRTAARDIGVVLERPDQLAFASPLATNSNSGNTGNASISAGSVGSLEDLDDNALGLFTRLGNMTTPLLVQFTSPTSYDVLDNSDPANPVPLDPPIRNRVFVPGQANPLFSQDPGETLVAASGSVLGIGAVVNGAAPLAAVANGYPSESYRFLHTDPVTGNISQQNITPAANSTARTIASQISDVAGVSANARNAITLSGFAGLSNSSPLQINLNGVDLIEYNGGVINASVPDPAANPAAFNAYLADRINADAGFNGLGIFAAAATNPVSGLPELRVTSTRGDDFNVTLEAPGAESLVVSDYNNTSQTLSGAGAGNEATVTIGGTLDILLASDIRLQTIPAISSILGDSGAADFARSTYLGIAASINGVADSGDQFTLEFNRDGISDNRNALALVALSSSKIVEHGERTLGDAYATLVELVGIETNAATINLDASEQVLSQTRELRDSISAVNLDEEAANLIQFEQIYNANAQVIAVARDLFDRLINVF